MTPEEASKDEALIKKVVGQTTTLNADGFGLCPFHEEKSPSFHVFQARSGKQRFHCFGCDARGDVIDFVRRSRGLSFRAAMTVLADIKRVTPEFISVPGLPGWPTSANICSECETSYDYADGKAVENRILRRLLRFPAIDRPTNESSETEYQLRTQVLRLTGFILNKAKAGDEESQKFMLDWMEQRPTLDLHPINSLNAG